MRVSSATVTKDDLIRANKHVFQQASSLVKRSLAEVKSRFATLGKGVPSSRLQLAPRN